MNFGPKPIGLAKSSYGGCKLAVIYSDGSTLDGVYHAPSGPVLEVSNSGDVAMVITEGIGGKGRMMNIIRISDGNCIGIRAM